MEALLEKLDLRLREWRPETATEVRKVLAEIVDLADQDAPRLGAVANSGVGSPGPDR